MHYLTMPEGFRFFMQFYIYVPTDYTTVTGELRFDTDGKVWSAASQEGYHLARWSVIYSI